MDVHILGSKFAKTSQQFVYETIRKNFWKKTVYIFHTLWSTFLSVLKTYYYQTEISNKICQISRKQMDFKKMTEKCSFNSEKSIWQKVKKNQAILDLISGKKIGH